MNVKKIAVFAALFYPMFVFANTEWIDSVVTQLTALFSDVVAVLVGVALVLFLWGVVRFVLNSGDEKAVEEGKKMMIWGITALFVMVSVWGLVELLQTIFGATGNPAFNTPQAGNPL